MKYLKSLRSNLLVIGITILSSLQCTAQNPFGPQIQFFQLIEEFADANVAEVYRKTYDQDRVVDSSVYFFRTPYALDSTFEWHTDGSMIRKYFYDGESRLIGLMQIEANSGTVDTTIQTIEYSNYNDVTLLKKVVVHDQNGEEISSADYDFRSDGSSMLWHNVKEAVYRSSFAYYVEDSILRTDTYQSKGDDTLSFDLIKSEYAIYNEVFQVIEHGLYDLNESSLSQRKGIPLMKVYEQLLPTSSYPDSLCILNPQGHVVEIGNTHQLISYIYNQDGTLLGCYFSETESSILPAIKHAYAQNINVDISSSKRVALALYKNAYGLPYLISYTIDDIATGDRIIFRYTYR